jgi:hypothetical protein
MQFDFSRGEQLGDLTPDDTVGLTREIRRVRDPSLRLKGGSVQDDHDV